MKEIARITQTKPEFQEFAQDKQAWAYWMAIESAPFQDVVGLVDESGRRWQIGRPNLGSGVYFRGSVPPKVIDKALPLEWQWSWNDDWQLLCE